MIIKKPIDWWKCGTFTQYATCGTRGENAVQYNAKRDGWSLYW